VLRVARALDGLVTGVAETLAWLVFGVVGLLYVQMPVRDLLVGTGILQNARPQEVINDYGQLLHASVFVVGIPYAIVLDRHVRFDVFRDRFSPRARAIVEALGHLLFVLPWAAVLAYYGAPHVLRSLQVGETFPDTGTLGYPLLRLAFALFVALLFVASIARTLVALHQVFAAAESA
jgi:TRAP-type mannitol/chloroaromatic compound transport system permease small subunit